MMPSCDQTGVPGVVGLTHFHSSTTSRSACLMSARILPRVFPRQSQSSAILFEMSSDADWPWFAPDFFMFSSYYRSSRHLGAGGVRHLAQVLDDRLGEGGSLTQVGVDGGVALGHGRVSAMTAAAGQPDQ